MIRLRAPEWLRAVLLAPAEVHPRPAQEITLNARRAERRAEDEARAAKRLYPKRRKADFVLPSAEGEAGYPQDMHDE